MDSINQLYLEKSSIKNIQKLFKANKSLPGVQLPSFFSPVYYSELKKEITGLPYVKETMITKHSFSSAELPSSLKKVLHSKEFLRMLSKVTHKRVHGVKAEVYRFGWKDHIVLHDKAVEKPGFDIIIDFTDTWDDEVGGTIVYVDGTGEYSRVPPQGNMIMIAKRQNNVHKFVQYLNHKTKGRKRYVIMGTLR